ncbi:MAG: helix-turn-helix transcriptional regulator [Verrucomicrobiota bacterium]
MKKKTNKAPSGIVSRLGVQVKERRRIAGLTQAATARRAGVGLRFIRDLEQGKVTVRVDKVNQVLALFGYHLEPVKDNEAAA